MEKIMALSNARLKEYVANFLLFCLVVLAWTYAITAGKFVSERHLHTLNLEDSARKGLEKLSNEPQS